MKKLAITLFLVLLCCAGLLKINLVAKESLSRAAQTPAEPTYRGVVLDESGKPFAGAIVRTNLRFGPEFSVSDAEGRFSLFVEKPWSWDKFWAVSPDGKMLGQTNAHKKNEDTKDSSELKITLQSNVRTITGKVVDASGKPIVKASVGGAGQCAKPILVESDSEGNFRFPWPSEETLQQVYAFKDGVGFDFAGTDEPDQAEDRVDPEKIDNGPFTLVLQKPQSVQVRIVDQNQLPIAGAKVSPWLIRKKEHKVGGNHGSFNTAHGPWCCKATTDENGIARFNWIPTENISRITFSAYGNNKGNPAKNGTVQFFGNARINYEPNATKNSWWADECTNGRCSLVKEGKEEKYVFPPDELGIISLELPKQAKTVGTVKYSDGTPVPNVMVSRKEHNQCGHGVRFTNDQGEFELTENAGTKLNLAVESTKECLPALFAYDMGNGDEVKKLEFNLKKGVKLRGTVFGPDGKPIQKEIFSVMIYEENSDPAFPNDISIRQTSNYENPEKAAGKYEYVLPPGKFRVQAGCQNMGSDAQKIEVKPDQTGEIVLDFHLQPFKKFD